MGTTMSTPYFPEKGRKPHLWRIRKSGHRELFLSKRWGMRGAYASKIIAGREVMKTIVEEFDNYILCRFQLKDGFWSDITTEARERESEARRSTFELVQPEIDPEQDEDFYEKVENYGEVIATKWVECGLAGADVLMLYEYHGKYYVASEQGMEVYDDLDDAAICNGITLDEDEE